MGVAGGQNSVRPLVGFMGREPTGRRPTCMKSGSEHLGVVARKGNMQSSNLQTQEAREEAGNKTERDGNAYDEWQQCVFRDALLHEKSRACGLHIGP